LLPGAVSEAKCNEIIWRGTQLPSQQASIGFDNDRQDDSYRKSVIRWFPPRKNPDIVNLIMEHVYEANRETFGFDIFPTTYDLQFTEYHATNNGKYDWHHDVWWENNKPHDRKLSVVLQLTSPSEYTGGDFEFNAPEINASDIASFKQQGSILIFPSFLFHRVTPLLTGTRYSLVTWIEGPKFR
jgi:PKHD-type hydroxylase